MRILQFSLPRATMRSIIAFLLGPILLILVLLSPPEVHCETFAFQQPNISSPEKRWLLKFRETSGCNVSENLPDCANSVQLTVPTSTLPMLPISGSSAPKNLISKTSEPWYSDFPILPVLFAESTSLPDGLCKTQSRRFLRDLKNGTLWAIQMFDASVKYPEGILSGNTRHYGSFDQCYHLSVNVPPSEDFEGESSENIRGRYNLVGYQFQQLNVPPINQGPNTYEFDPNDSAWEAIREKGDFRKVPRYYIELALCVPSSCSVEEIKLGLKKPIEDFAARKNLIVKVSLDEKHSQTKDDEPLFTLGAKIYCGIALTLFVLVVVSSCYDSAQDGQNQEESLTKDLLLCFSAKRNVKSIFEVRYNHPGLDAIHMIRFFAMCLVLVGHRTMQYYNNPTSNVYYFEKFLLFPSSMMLFNGPIIVDAFLGIGGLLLAYGLLLELEKRKKMNFIPLILVRFTRLTPLYMIIIFFHSLILPHLGTGPLWKYRVGIEHDNCGKNWWASMLYVNNYVRNEELCMFQSWYLSVDFQMYIVSLFVIYAFWKMPRRMGYLLLSLLTLASCLLPAVITYIKHIKPVFTGVLSILDDVRNDDYFTHYYIKTHMRSSGYFIGLISGAVLYDCTKSTWRLPKLWSRILFMIFVVITSIVSQALAFPYFQPSSNVSILQTALYAGFHRLFFSFSFCAVVILFTIGDGLEFHYNFCTPTWVQPLARLTYSTFLVHNINQIYDIGVMRASRTFSVHTMFWDFIPDVFYSFFLAFLCAIGIEGPFRKIEQRLLRKKAVKSEEQERSPVIKTKKID
ncbi:nose resistant to fluoxetine protein 6-like [Prorops nasuta]|uniref:nose resistant to fluoxetine protein 6-like n=1 Tax=Prorops nasuta TaxID=863751 RepID=UPI0034CF45D0